MFGIAFGMLNIAPDVFFEQYDFRFFWAAVQNKHDQIQHSDSQIEVLVKETWYQTRLLFGILYNSNVKKADQKDPEKLLPFPWEKTHPAEPGEPYSKQELDELIEKAKNVQQKADIYVWSEHHSASKGIVKRTEITN